MGRQWVYRRPHHVSGRPRVFHVTASPALFNARSGGRTRVLDIAAGDVLRRVALQTAGGESLRTVADGGSLTITFHEN